MLNMKIRYYHLDVSNNFSVFKELFFVDEIKSSCPLAENLLAQSPLHNEV